MAEVCAQDVRVEPPRPAISPARNSDVEREHALHHSEPPAVLGDFPQLSALRPHETPAILLIHLHLRHVMGFSQSVASTG